MNWFNSTQNRERTLMLFLVTGLCIVMLSPEFAFAGEGGKEFGAVWDQICVWLKGGLGRLLCGSTILVGVVIGVARQSLMAFGVGIGLGVGLYNLPDIVKAIIGAAIASDVGTLGMFSNGLS